MGVYVLPSLLTRARTFLNAETLLVVSMGLCFSMAVFSVVCGFSLELGAFVMGSILAGTNMAERIEHVVSPVKDLFGAVFFISVGMMVDPTVLTQYWGEILLLAVVVIAGMIVFGTLGMLITGQSLRVSIESGFTLTQIGEFSFIIASLGMSLGVLQESLYPIIVAVSVITIFTTPYFVKLSQPASKWAERHLPKGLGFLIDRYSKQAVDTGQTRRLWHDVLSRYVWRIVVYSVILLAIILLSLKILFPLLCGIMPGWGRLLSTAITLLAMSPFLGALSFSSTKPDERMRLHSSASFYDVPLVAMRIVRYLVALLFIVYFLTMAYNSVIGWISGIIFFAVILLFASTKLKQRYLRMEEKFMNNLNIRENTRLGVGHNLVSDMHQAYIQVGPSCHFVGDRIEDSGLRTRYGVSVSSIQRGETLLPLPTKEERIFPGDVIGVIGNDEQIKRLNDDIERDAANAMRKAPDRPPVELRSIRLTENSPLVGRPLSETHMRRDYYSMIVKIQRDEDLFVQPEPTTVLEPGDVVWVVGDASRFDKLR